MYVMSVRVNIQGDRRESDAHLHSTVVPRTKALPGFMKGMWFGDDESGNGAVVFDTREHAEGAAAAVSSPPDGAVMVRDVTVYELKAEA
jgi:hypothetical protein